MYKVGASDFFQFIKENENAKKELMESLEKHNLLSLEKNKQEDVMLDAMIKLAKKYNFDIDKSDLKKSLNEGITELDDDQLLNVAGGFGLLPWAMLLLQLFSSGGSAVSTFFSSKSAEPTTKTAIVQSYDEQEETDLSDLKFNFKDNDNLDTNDNTPSGDIDLGTPDVEVQQNAENKIDDNEPSDDTNTDLSDVDLQQSVENKTDDNASGSDNIIAEASDAKDNNSVENETEITNDTTEAEINFSLKLLESLPKEGEPGFEDFLALPSLEGLGENEKKTYGQIENIVNELVQKVRSRTDVSKNAQLPEKMRVAKAIYRWVAKNIRYTDEKQPQNALFVFSNGRGNCRGYSALTNIMMRIAGIPCGCIGSFEHAYNTVYFVNPATGQEGWVLMDSTWAAPVSDRDFHSTGLTLEEFSQFKEKNLINSYMNWLAAVFNDDSNELSYSGYERLEEVNATKNPEKMDRVEEYIARVQAIVASIIQKYSDNMLDNVDNINEEIQTELNKINPDYQDIVTFKEFKVFSETDEEIGITNFFISVTTSLSYDEAKVLAELSHDEEQSLANDILNNKNAIKMKTYLPSFYNPNMDFTEANMSILKNHYHRIGLVGNRSIGDYYEGKQYNLEIDGLKYELRGNEGNAYIAMSGDSDNPLENVQIPSDLADLGMKFVICSGIKSITLNGNETIEGGSAFNLENINTEDSNKYIAEDGILYAKNANGAKGKRLAVFKTRGEINGINYSINMDYKNNKIIEIEIYNEGHKLENVEIPEQLAQFNVPIRVSTGIKSITLNGNETIEGGSAFDLENINTEDSNKYIAEDGILYAKNANGAKGKALYLFKWSGDIGNIHYYTNKDYSNNKLASIEICNYKGDDFASVTLPEQLTQFNVPIKIGDGIKSITLTGNQTIDTSYLPTSLEDINTENSNKYIAENGTLYVKTADGSKGDILVHFKTN